MGVPAMERQGETVRNNFAKTEFLHPKVFCDHCILTATKIQW